MRDRAHARAGGEVHGRGRRRGPGLPPGSEQRVFEKFFRGAPSGARRRRPRPRDLPRRSSTRTAGAIWAENRDGGGALLPLHAAARGERRPIRRRRGRADAVDARRERGRAPLVLVVEDEPQMRRFLRATLAARTATALRRGRHAARRRSCEAATPQPRRSSCSTSGLPDLDGLEVTRRLREWSASADHRALRARPGARQDRGARRRRRRLPHQALRRGELLARMRVALRHAARARRRRRPGVRASATCASTSARSASSPAARRCT